MIVLASQSGSRRAMLENAGVPFTARPAELDERAFEAALCDSAPAEIALSLAVAKARAVAHQSPGDLVLGSDSLVEVDGRRFDKPQSREDAAAHLRFFSGRVMHLHSAAALVRGDETLWQGVDVARLHVLALSDGFIEGYLDHEWPAVAACVGVFRIEGRGVQLFDRIEGDQFTVLGMPLFKVMGALRTLGVLAQ